MARAWARKASPSSVSCSRRVVRVSSVVPSFSSSRPRARLTPEVVWPSSSAAAVIEPLSITAMNACISSRVVFMAHY